MPTHTRLLQRLGSAACISFALGLVGANIAFAQQADPAAGQALFQNGDPARNLAACASCHGKGAASPMEDIPKLAGQTALYLRAQFSYFAKGERKHPLITAQARAIKASEIASLTSYLSQMRPFRAATRPMSEGLGEKIYRQGIPAKNVLACVTCHGALGEGLPYHQAPRIGGQHSRYMLVQLEKFHTGALRTPDGSKEQQVKSLSQDEVQAVVQYVSGL